MKKINASCIKRVGFVVLSLLCTEFTLHSQTLVGQTLDAVPGNSTTYDGQTRPHYGIRWTTDSWFQGAPTAWISSYGGMKFFTGLNDWLSIDINGNIKAKGQSFVINSPKVGIGTETPLSALHIENNDQTYVMIKATDYTMNPSVLTKKGGIVFSQQYADKTAGISFAVPRDIMCLVLFFQLK
ncbi:hypothetical protein [Niabella hibiscisoli]|uniref:hypothetical protein n=1 Tax=Niabella hibiscisoli TaxID=1825928 RepID=UPI001F0EA357|nr:hypothetical protein [Niabella hibiscisoli]MCH5718178.1 hypothetical protein [Niabella hibiscisoli]